MAEPGAHPSDPAAGIAEPGVRAPLTVPDLLAKSDGRPGRRVAARQAVVQVRRHLLRRFFAVLTTMLVALLASVAAYYVGLFFYLDRSVERVDALAIDAPGIISPDAQDSADNFLIVSTEGAGSDVAVSSALIAHLVPERDRAILISLPLTAFVDVPACDNGTEPVPRDPYGGSLASSYDIAGAGCLVGTVQQLSGMRMNHYVQLDLERLPGMVDSLGGVPVSLPADVTTGGQSGAPAGESVLDAEQVRAVLAEGDVDEDPTGELAIARQRLLLTSTLREALRLENLANPIAVTGFVSEAAGGLTLDPGTTLGELKDLGDKLGQFTADDTVAATVPLDRDSYQPVGSRQSFALIDHAASRAMFRAIIVDSELPDPTDLTDPTDPTDGTPSDRPDGDPSATSGAAPEAAGDQTPPPSAPPPPAPAPRAPAEPAPEVLTVAPAQITVNVYNGVGTPGLATDAAEQLTAQGFRVGLIENDFSGAVESVVRYGPGQLEAARTVAAAVPNSVLLEGPTSGGAIDLVVGSSFTGVVPVSPP